MADEPTTAASVDVQPAAPVDVAVTAPVTASAAPVTEPSQEKEKAEDVAAAPKPAEEEPAVGDDTMADVTATGIDDSIMADAPADGAAAATPASTKKGGKKAGGVPEHKSKKLQKKKSMPTLNLDAKPGDYYWARMKGHAPWPAIICDESMLPSQLLGSRPVSTARPDGSIRDDYAPGGKNAKDRTFAVMFLGTNEL